MPKNKISEYSTTNSDNTDIESINIDEGCAPSGINNAIRELMVHLKEFQTGASGDPLTVAGTFVASGGATIAASAGTSASPSIHFSSDTNTGIFSPAADTIAFAEGGVEVMRITSAGEVLVGGTTSVTGGSGQVVAMRTNSQPIFGLFRDDTTVTSGEGLGYLGFYGNDTTSNTPTLLAYVQGMAAGTHAAGDNPTSIVFGNTPDGSATVTERMRIDSAGNVGIGTDSPTAKLSVYGAQTGSGFLSNINSIDTSAVAANIGGGIAFGGTYTGTTITGWASVSGLKENATDGNYAGYLAFATRANGGSITECMRITSAGEVLVGGTTSVAANPGALILQRTDANPTLGLFRNDTSITSGNDFGVIGFYGSDTTSNTPTLHAYVQAVASGTHAAGDNPTDLVFGTTPDGSATVAEAMRLTQSKNLKIGGTASRATTEGTNQVVLFNGTAPVGTLTNGVSFYSASGEARVMDAAGNSTLLSPHDQSTNEWIFHSKHTPSGKVLRIDVERLLKFVNDHFGLDAVHEFIE